MTNYDRIKKMSIEEMASLLYYAPPCDICINISDTCKEKCYDGIVLYLKSEAK